MPDIDCALVCFRGDLLMLDYAVLLQAEEIQNSNSRLVQPTHRGEEIRQIESPVE